MNNEPRVTEKPAGIQFPPSKTDAATEMILKLGNVPSNRANRRKAAKLMAKLSAR